jgi:hypothetical protein
MNTTGDFWRPKSREFVSLVVKFLKTKDIWQMKSGETTISAMTDDKDKRRISKGDDLLILIRVAAAMI